MNTDNKLEASKLLSLIFLLKAVQPIAPAHLKNDYSQLRSRLEAKVAADGSFFNKSSHNNIVMIFDNNLIGQPCIL